MCTNKVLNCHDMTGVLLTLAAGAGATESVVPRTTAGFGPRVSLASLEHRRCQLTGGWGNAVELSSAALIKWRGDSYFLV